MFILLFIQIINNLLTCCYQRESIIIIWEKDRNFKQRMVKVELWWDVAAFGRNKNVLGLMAVWKRSFFVKVIVTQNKIAVDELQMASSVKILFVRLLLLKTALEHIRYVDNSLLIQLKHQMDRQLHYEHWLVTTQKNPIKLSTAVYFQQAKLTAFSSFCLKEL